MMSVLSFLVRLLPLLIALAAVGWLLFQWLKKSDEPASLAIRLGVSAVLAGALCWGAARANDEISKIAMILVASVAGIVYAALWGPSFCGAVAKQFTALYDGGDQELEPQPLYSMAEAKRKRGHYLDAIAEVRTQLQRFPTDFTGWMMLAEIQAEDLKDLAAAEQTIDEILTQEHAPKNVAFALNRLADWRLKLAQDPEAAREALERVVALLPDSEPAQLARQRIAHLASEKSLVEQHDRPRIAMKHYEENIGLRHDFTDLKPPPENPAALAAGYVAHLEQFPNDNEAREKLALVYADHYGRLDLATDQLEQLIATPHQPQKQVAHWLNLLADIQVRLAGDASLARATLQRIVDLYPKSALAENARHRIAYLKLELKPHEKSQAIKLGSYEQNIGLKGKP